MSPTIELAFPSSGSAFYGESRGMTLRDYFAASCIGHLLSVCHSSPHLPTLPSTVANMAYDVADAMLKVRDAAR